MQIGNAHCLCSLPVNLKLIRSYSLFNKENHSLGSSGATSPSQASQGPREERAAGAAQSQHPIQAASLRPTLLTARADREHWRGKDTGRYLRPVPLSRGGAPKLLCVLFTLVCRGVLCHVTGRRAPQAGGDVGATSIAAP